jgi:SpoU rRNA methylase family enzyme|tara:strand:+ start:702 stop:926 length:225 start_codon:yes stop_codon:yes gene_type:complete
MKPGDLIRSKKGIDFPEINLVINEGDVGLVMEVNAADTEENIMFNDGEKSIICLIKGAEIGFYEYELEAINEDR